MLCHLAISVFPLNMVNVGGFVAVVALTMPVRSIGCCLDVCCCSGGLPGACTILSIFGVVSSLFSDVDGGVDCEMLEVFSCCMAAMIVSVTDLLISVTIVFTEF